MIQDVHNMMKFVDEKYNKGTNMLLVHEVIKGGKYFAEAKKLKGEKYLDNGFFELGKSLDVTTMLDAAEIIEATVLICEDGTRNGMGEYKAHGYKVMCVPTSITQANMMLADDGIDLVGISGIHFKDRYEALSKLDMPDSPKIHMLGMKSPDEFCKLSEFKKHIVSWDTSAAIWQGYLGHQLSILPEKDKTPVDFSVQAEFNLIMEDNIKYIEECIK